GTAHGLSAGRARSECRRDCRATRTGCDRTCLMSNSQAPVLLSSDCDGVRTLTLNRPERKNAINAQLWEELADALRAAAREPDLRALVVTGAGGAFCSGADIGVPEDIHPQHKLR